MAAPRIVVVCWGELVWDQLTDVNGNSTQLLGGSALAMAVHLQALGAESRLVSAVGDDPEGHQAIAELERRGLSSAHLLRAKHTQTAAVRVRFEAGEPIYEASRRLDWSSLDFEPSLRAALAQADALAFNLYAQHHCLPLEQLRRAVHVRGRPRWIGCDLNLRRDLPPAALRDVAELSDLVKANQLETTRAARILGTSDLPRWFREHGRTRALVVTQGASGAELFGGEGVVQQRTTSTASVVDRVGAGDAFMAMLTFALLTGSSERRALESACEYAESQLLNQGALPAVTTSDSH